MVFMPEIESSYEDIVEVLREEGVFDDSLGADLHELVKLRKPLVSMHLMRPCWRFGSRGLLNFCKLSDNPWSNICSANC